MESTDRYSILDFAFADRNHGYDDSSFFIPMIGGVHLNEESHVYTDPDGRRLLSVTDVLKIEGFINSSFYDQVGRIRGRVVHYGIKLLERGTLDWKSVDPIIEPYLAAYHLAKKEIEWKTWLYEQQVYDPLLCYGGTLDFAGVMFGAPTIMDYKTGSVAHWTGYQTAGYEGCLNYMHACAWAKIPPRPFKRFGLELRDDGKYDLKPFANPNDLRLFRSMVSLAWEKVNNGYIKLGGEEKWQLQK